MNNQDKAIVAALVGLLLVWIFWLSPKMVPTPTPRPQPPQPIATQPTPVQPQPKNPPAQTDAPPVLTAAPLPVNPPPTSTQPLAPEQTAHLKNEFIDVELTNYGGGVKAVKLLQFDVTSTDGEKSKIVLNQYSKLPALMLGKIPLIAKMTATDTSVVFEQVMGDGWKVKQTFTLAAPKEFGAASDYLIKCQLSFESTDGQPHTLSELMVLGGSAGPLGAKDKGSYWGVDWYNGQDTLHRALGDVQKQPLVANESAQWIAVKNQYFAMVLTPENAGTAVGCVAFPASQKVPKDAVETILSDSLQLAPIEVAPTQVTTREVSLYAGPKEYKRLSDLGKHQDELLQLGRLILWQFSFVSAIAKILLLGLLAIQGVVKNFGVAIFLLTAAIRLLFWPLTGYGTRQMKKMQALAPQVKALQEKYKDDMMKAHAEMRVLYKQNNVHQLGGCLPMLIQLPFFVAFYSILMSASELWGKPFLWVHDLSQPDALFYMGSFRFDLMMLIMAATQFWQAWITPATDPSQAKMARMMPIIFVAMMYMWNFSAALVLYWTISNLFTIAQTYLTREKPTAVAATSNLKRKLK